MKIDIIVPSYRHVNSNCFQAVIGMVNRTTEAGHSVRLAEIYNNSYPHWARNDGLMRIRPDCDFVLFCDDDMVPEKDALLRLLAHDMPVVSALCTTRGIPVKLTITAFDEETQLFHHIDSVEPGTVMVGKLGCGAAFLLVSRAVINDIRGAWLVGADFLNDNEASFNRMRVSAWQREQERLRIVALRAEYLANEPKATPMWFNLHDTESGYQLGEDVGFCRRAIQCGYDIAVDTTVQVGHVGDFPFHPVHLGIKSENEVMVA